MPVAEDSLLSDVRSLVRNIDLHLFRDQPVQTSSILFRSTEELNERSRLLILYSHII